MRDFFRKKNAICLITCTAGFASVCAKADGASYVVQPGDTLSQIIQKTFPGRIYGRKGNLAKYIEKNSNHLNDPDKIFPGESLEVSTLGILSTAQARVPSAVVEENENASAENSPVSKNATSREVTAANVPVASEEKSIFGIAPRFSYDRIDSTDRASGGRSTLGSNLSVGAEIDWQQVWSRHFSTAIIIGLDHVSDATLGKAIDQSSFDRSEAGFKLDLHDESGFHFINTLKVETAPFVLATGSNSLTIDTVLIPEVETGGFKTFARTDLFRFDIGASVGLKAPSAQNTYRVQAGYDYRLFLNLVQTQGAVPLNTQFFYNHISQSTSITHQTETTLGISLGIDFDLTPRAVKQ